MFSGKLELSKDEKMLLELYKAQVYSHLLVGVPFLLVSITTLTNKRIFLLYVINFFKVEVIFVFNTFHVQVSIGNYTGKCWFFLTQFFIWF